MGRLFDLQSLFEDPWIYYLIGHIKKCIYGHTYHTYKHIIATYFDNRRWSGVWHCSTYSKGHAMFLCVMARAR